MQQYLIMLPVVAELTTADHISQTVAKWGHNLTNRLVELLGTSQGQFIDTIGMVS